MSSTQQPPLRHETPGPTRTLRWGPARDREGPDRSLAAEDRYARLLAAVRRAVPADAACLFRLEGYDLFRWPAHGLTDEALAMRYPVAEHPRLDIILRPEPGPLPPDSPLPDPFDGMLAADPGALRHVHACLGCAHRGRRGRRRSHRRRPRAPRLRPPRRAVPCHPRGARRRSGADDDPDRAARTDAKHRDTVARELQRDAGRRAARRSSARPRLPGPAPDVELVASSDFPVLVTGETGVGKELVARRSTPAPPAGTSR